MYYLGLSGVFGDLVRPSSGMLGLRRNGSQLTWLVYWSAVISRAFSIFLFPTQHQGHRTSDTTVMSNLSRAADAILVSIVSPVFTRFLSRKYIEKIRTWTLWFRPLGYKRVYLPLGHERVYLPLYKVADTPFISKGTIYFCGEITANTWTLYPLSRTIVVLLAGYITVIRSLGTKCVSRLITICNVWSQIKSKLVIFTHLKMWVPVARQNFKCVENK